MSCGFSRGKIYSDFDLPDEGINVEDLEKDLLKKAMHKSNGVAAKAVKLLGVSYKGLLYKIQKYGLDGDES